MEKVFLDTAPAADARQTRFEGFQNECVSFQAAVMSDDAPARLPVMLRAQSPLGSRVCVRSVRSVPVTLATLPGADDNYLRKTPGLYPDLLSDRLRTHLQAGLWHAFWVEVTPEGAAAGDYEIQLQLLHADTGEVLSQASACVRILPGFLPEQMLRRTNWFHSDCLAQYYRVPVFSAEHWQLIERFMAVAARRGVNMILTPLFTPPLECDLSIHLDRITVESVRRLEQLAPYGAENPTPVFVLEKAVIDGIYPVSEGKHCRLRLRQGNASIYAVWFGMHPEQLPYTMGDVVDAALNLSVYEAPRGAQLSGRILELHPAGLGNAAAEQTALVQALRRGTPLTAEQKQRIAPERSDIITVYRELQTRRWHAEDLQPLFAKLGEQNTGKILVAITALEQVGLIAVHERGGAKFWELVPAQGKKNLADAPILKCLEER